MSFAAMGKGLDYPGDGVGAVECAFGTAQDFDFIDVVEREIGKVKRAAGQIYCRAIDKHFGLIGIAAIQEDPGKAAFGAGAVDGDARRVYQDIGEGNGLALLDFVTGDDGYGCGSFLRQGGFRLRSDYDASGEALEFEVEMEFARLSRGKIQNQVTGDEGFAGEMDTIAAGRNIERVGTVVFGGGR